MQKNPLSQSDRRIKAFSHVDAVFFSLMIGLGETFFVPFGLEFGISVKHSGLLASWPACIGATIQFVSYQRLLKVSPPGKTVALLVALQVVCLIAIAASGAYLNGNSFLLYALMLFGSVYWFCTFAVGPIWNIWITQIIPSDEMVSFFSNRQRLSQLSLFVSFLIAGIIFEKSALPNSMIFILFFIAAASARVVSGIFLLKLPLPKVRAFKFAKSTHESKTSKSPSIKLFVVFVCALYGSVWIAAPFFTGYMLRYLKLSYNEFIIITGTLVAGRFFFAPLIDRFYFRFGIKNLLILGAFIILWLPIMWLQSSDLTYLCLLQIAGGFGWGALELGIHVFMIQSWDVNERSRVLSWFNLSMAVSMAVGSYVGARMLGIYGSESFEILFTSSSVLRFFPFLLLFFIGTKNITFTKFFSRIVAVRVGSGPISKPILYVGSPGDKPKDTP